MSKALVIVESFVKSKTINKYLGSDYVVKSSIGHIRDLPISGSRNQKNTYICKKKKSKLDSQNVLFNQIGIDPYHDWKAHYEILPGKEKIVAELKALAEKSDHIYLATDIDREGEAIAWHLREVIGGDEKRFSRVIFNEITHHAITQAFNNPGKLNIYRINAQQARRFMDRIVGYMVSPLLWKKIAHGLSAGRVQSVAVRLIVERERAIKTFIPKQYWKIYVYLRSDAQASSLKMQVIYQKNRPFKPVSQQQIQEALLLLKKANYIVSDRKDKLIRSKPNAPFTTSTLQQVSNTSLGYSIKKTMLLAQRLYEAGYITYVRTDSTNLSHDALQMVRDYIKNTFDSKYLPRKPNKYISKNNAQEAHEAIRPCYVNVVAEKLKNIESDARKLYQLIWRQFVACQMMPAQYDDYTVTVIAGEFRLQTRGRTLRFDGWTRVMPMSHNNIDDILLKVKIDYAFTLEKLISKQCFSKPPARYNEASLVRELEKRGIGRPSTYASIISTIQNRGYVHMENYRFYAEKIGEIVIDRLKENFFDLINYDFTAKMENSLDQIAINQQKWKNVLNSFFKKLNQQLKNAEKDPEKGGMKSNRMIIINFNCPICNRKMGIRTASTGMFLGCSGYLLVPKERCKNTINLLLESKALNELKDGDANTNVLRSRQRCTKCRAVMDTYVIKYQYKLHICSNNPLCDGYEIEQIKFHIRGYDGSVIKYEKCTSDIHLKLDDLVSI